MVLSYAQATQIGVVTIPVGSPLTSFDGFPNTFTESAAQINPVAGTIILAPNSVYVVSYRLTGREDGVVPPININLRTELYLDGVVVPGSIATQNILATLPVATASDSAVSGNVIVRTLNTGIAQVLTLRNVSAISAAGGLPATLFSDIVFTVMRIR